MKKPRTDNWTSECECGNAKSRHVQSCDRCAFLDGRTSVQLAVISALRDGVTLSLAGIVEDAGSGERSVYRVLRKLEEQGRVRSFDEESDATRKVYTLVEARAA